MNTLVFVVLLCVVAAYSSFSEVELDAKFADWMVEYEKRYTVDEFKARRAIWADNLRFVLENNARPDVTYTVGMNKFADLTNEEFRNLYLMTNKTFEPTAEELAKAAAYETESATVGANPTSFDWRNKGAVSGVKDQGQCGSCWAFSTTGVVEGAFKIGGGSSSVLSLSEQELVSCDKTNYGCNGGWPIDAMSWLMKQGGLPSESNYPYTSGKTKTSGSCESGHKAVATLHKYHQVTKYSESALETEVATVGPVSVCIDASHTSFQLYTSGVYNEPRCSQTNLDHAVLTVGYDNSGHYWIVKNSWGTGWGQKGYIWMTKNGSNQCGIASAAVSGSY